MSEILLAFLKNFLKVSLPQLSFLYTKALRVPITFDEGERCSITVRVSVVFALPPQPS